MPLWFEQGGTTSRGYLASEIGCKLDCDLRTGKGVNGGEATDNTSVINDLLRTATATNPIHLTIDGGTLTTGIILNGGYTTIEGIGPASGFYLKSGSNADVIRNGQDVTLDPGPGHAPPPKISFGITLRNFYVHGNRGDGKTGNASHGMTYDTSGLPMLYGIDLVSAYGIRIEDVVLHDVTTYAVRLSNCSSVICRGIRVEAPSNDKNTDGIHIDGPATDIHISDCYFQTGDDAIALNAPEGYGGAIARVTVTNCVFERALTAIRIYGCYKNLQFPVSDVVLSNCTGSVQNCPYMIGFLGGSPPDMIQGFQASNCMFEASYWATINDSCGVQSYHANTWESPKNAGFFVWIPERVTISSCTLADCRIYRSTRGSAAAFGVYARKDAAGSVIEKLAIEGFAIENEAGQNFAPVPYLIDTTFVTINELYIGSLDPKNIAALVNPANEFKGIGTISGPGVLATGFEIPDNVMADNVPYLSATGKNRGKPSIKLGGKVKKL